MCVYTYRKVWKWTHQADNIYYIRKIELEAEEEEKQLFFLHILFYFLLQWNILDFEFKNINIFSPGWCGSEDWVLACKTKGRLLNSHSGHMPGLWSRSTAGGAREATTHWSYSPPLSPSLLLSRKINKKYLYKIY